MILGASILQLPAIRKAKEMGLQVIVLDRDPNAVGFREDNIIREQISTIDTENVMNVALQYKINGIMTLASDMPMQTVAAVAEELHLIGISKETALKTTNKGLMRESLLKAGIGIPYFQRCTTQEEAIIACRTIGKKAIIKPCDNSGSRGVIVLPAKSSDEQIKDAFQYSISHSRSKETIVEEYMDGPEVSVESLSIEGHCKVIQITDKRTTGSPFFVEMGHAQPSQLKVAELNKIEEVTVAANQALGIQNGPAHTEIIVTTDGPKIVEVGARLGGDCITSHLVKYSTGIDMVQSSIEIILGKEPNLTPQYSKGAAIRYIKATGGRIEKIVGVEDARKMPGIKDVELVHKEGEIIEEIRNSNDRIGFVIAQGENAQDAIEKSENALRKIVVYINKE